MKITAYFFFLILFISSCQSQPKTDVVDANLDAVLGDWYGVLKVQGQELRIVFHINKKEGAYQCTMDSPDQGATDIPTTASHFKDNTLVVEIESMKLKYEGQLSEDGSEIAGTFQQGGASFPLNLSKEKIEKKAQAARPQDPKDFPYQQEEVKFVNPKGGHQLAGTLTKPEGDKFEKVVILISGSGPQNRNEEIASFNHRPFLVLSDYLTRNGIAVLRYDDRGVGESEGSQSDATTKDFADDAAAAVAFLQQRADMKGKKIGLIGHSEGGMIAPIVAVENKAVDFIVLLAGPGIPIDQLMHLQAQKIGDAEGAPKDIQAINLEVTDAAYKFIRANANLGEKELADGLYKVFEQGMKKFPAKTLEEIGEIEPFIKDQVKGITNKWFLYFIRFNPADYLTKVKCPVLAINGSLDLQVTAVENLAGIEKALKAAGNKKVTIKNFEGQNHLFQKATTGAPSEYAKIEETFNAETLAFIADWLNK